MIMIEDTPSRVPFHHGGCDSRRLIYYRLPILKRVINSVIIVG